jgi:hypothetical protein
MPGVVVNALALDPHHPGTVYAGTVGRSVLVLQPADSRITRDLMNVSTRGVVGAGESELKAGFIVRGSESESLRVLIKGEGPILGMPGVIADPQLVLTRLDGSLIKSGDDWQADLTAAEVNTLAPPAVAAEAAFVIDLEPGSYIASLRGKGGATGLGIVSVTEVRAFSALPTPAGGELVSVSTRGLVGSGENELKVGFIIQGMQSLQLLIKGEGPILGMPGVIADPEVVVTDLQGVEIARNDDWQSGSSASEVAALAPPAVSQEAALVLELQPGAYIAHLRGKGGATGLGIVSVTEVRAFALSTTTLAH